MCIQVYGMKLPHTEKPARPVGPSYRLEAHGQGQQALWHQPREREGGKKKKKKKRKKEKIIINRR